MNTIWSFFETFFVRKPHSPEAHNYSEIADEISETTNPSEDISFNLKICKIHTDSIIPTRGSNYAAGLDLYAYIQSTEFEDPQTIILAPGQRESILTGIKIGLPNTECYGKIAPRSGTSIIRHSSGLALGGIDVAAGVIDRDYRGEVKVVLVNNSTVDFTIKHGQRIAQLIIEKTIPVKIEEVFELDATSRGANGFGSTGM